MSSQGPRTLETQLLLLQMQTILAHNPQDNVTFSLPVEKPVNEMQLRQQALDKNNQIPKKQKPTHYENRDTPMNRRPTNRGGK
ncbi:hypothetical protein [Candidatus Berkiella aquae]|uniref:Uncharacterized protein n=1 Tax=Candidatus Berkiella aquae TaxID=295108 RepID=A0A0Q9YLX0_9GAMM|nr:hypothetical protein [Candidatus Berkiella aquae]MCS5710599.1 hypothetical protein [Candidatus Berkiella aquae]